MGRHSSLIKLGADLGYFKDESGICNGVTTAWIEACFCNEEAAFNQRIDTIHSLSDTASFIEQITNIKEKVKQRIPLLPQEEDSLAILAFFEKIALYQLPHENKALFGETLTQNDQDEISKIISSDKIQIQGGIVMLSPHTGIYTADELKKYLLNIASAIEEASPALNDKVNNKAAVLIQSPDHAMALMYEKHQQGKAVIPYWRFMDINLNESPLIRVENIDGVINFIRNSYYNKDDTYLVFSTDILTTRMNPNKDQLVNNIKLIERPSSMTLEKLKSGRGWRSSQDTMTQQAVRIGDIDTLSQLSDDVVAKALTSVTYAHPRALIYLIEQGYNPDIILNQAAKEGFPAVINVCSAKKIDLDLPFLHVLSPPPLFIAARYGNLNVIRALHNHGAHLDIKSPNGCNIAHFAAANGHDNIIAWLATNQPDLLTEKDNEGETPAHVAAKNGAEPVLREIIKSTLLSPDAWNKLLLTAAYEGHAHLVPLFASQGVDLSQLGPHGYGAAHMAADAGNVAFLSALSNSGVDLCAETADGKTPLMLALTPSRPWVKRANPENITAITAIIEAQLNEKCKKNTINIKQTLQSIQQKNQEEVELPETKNTHPSGKSA